MKVLLFVATWIELGDIVFKSNEPQNEKQLLPLLIFTRMLGQISQKYRSEDWSQTSQGRGVDEYGGKLSKEAQSTARWKE